MTDVAEGSATGVDESQRVDGARGHVPGESSMWFFVIGDLLIFAVYFVGYMYFRGQHQNMFLRSQARLNVDIGAVNTVMLLTSSLFVALGTTAARADFGDPLEQLEQRESGPERERNHPSPQRIYRIPGASRRSSQGHEQ